MISAGIFLLLFMAGAALTMCIMFYMLLKLIKSIITGLFNTISSLIWHHRVK